MGQILVVDDNPGMVNLVGKILRKAGHDVVGVTCGEKALEVLNEITPDLVLLDIMMPYLDGWATLQKIRGHDRLKDVPVAMLSAKKITPETVGRDDIVELVDYIEKPFTIQGLLNSVDEILADLQNIANEAGRMRDMGLDPESVRNYEMAARLEHLHTRLIRNLEMDLGKAHNTFNAKVTGEAIMMERRAVKRFGQRRKAIEKSLPQGGHLSSGVGAYPRRRGESLV